MPRLFGAWAAAGFSGAPFFVSGLECADAIPLREIFLGKFTAAVMRQDEIGLPVKEIFRSNHRPKENLLIKK
jgi:hypothetical protein